MITIYVLPTYRFPFAPDFVGGGFLVSTVSVEELVTRSAVMPFERKKSTKFLERSFAKPGLFPFELGRNKNLGQFSQTCT